MLYLRSKSKPPDNGKIMPPRGSMKINILITIRYDLLLPSAQISMRFNMGPCGIGKHIFITVDKNRPT